MLRKDFIVDMETIQDDIVFDNFNKEEEGYQRILSTLGVV